MTVPVPDFPILVDEARVRKRIAEMAEALRGDPELRWVAVLHGARHFADALCRNLGRPAGEYDTVRVSSYGAGTVSSGRIELVKDLSSSPEGQRIAILEDIVDTGRTVHWLRERFLERGAQSVEVHTLLSKPSRRVVEVELEGVGFEIPDEFVIGFGMDVAGRFRELPYIAVYDESIERASRSA
ncbi:MAG: hypoxanthine phosphoribosyltransferase [Planctomycetota bacterium]|nr:MAG: hypoxanthine phosphoribosyltransferase [Planctomycetota bacterium]